MHCLHPVWRDRWRISACDSSSSLVTCHDPILNSVSRWNLSWVAPVKRQLLVFCFPSRNNLLSSGRSNYNISVYFMTTLLPKLNGIYVCFAIPEHALQVLCSDMRRPISDPWVDRTSHTTDTLPTPYICCDLPGWPGMAPRPLLLSFLSLRKHFWASTTASQLLCFVKLLRVRFRKRAQNVTVCVNKNCM